MENIKINKLEIENVKRVKAVQMTPSPTGLTIIGGNNDQGKSTVLDSIAWVLGGNKFKPSTPTREGSVLPPALKVTLSNGLIVERKGKNSDLKVTDPTGKKAGQNLLDSFVEEFALDLPKFMGQSNKDKADTLLKIIGVGEKLAKLEHEEKELYSERYMIGRVADQKEKYAKEMETYKDVPDDMVSASDLIKQQQAILVRNAENQKHRENLQGLIDAQAREEYGYKELAKKIAELENRIEELKKIKANKGTMIKEYEANRIIAQKTVQQLQDESTEELEENIQKVEEINRKVRANLDKEKAEEDAKAYKTEYNKMSQKIEDVRRKRMDLLSGANFPLPELSIEDNELTYQGFKWDNLSSSKKLIVATSIVKKLKPECGFVLMDELEKMDLDTLKQFGVWLESEQLQVIATRVSTGEECSIIIEDGQVAKMKEETPKQSKEFQAGVF